MAEADSTVGATRICTSGGAGPVHWSTPTLCSVRSISFRCCMSQLAHDIVLMLSMVHITDADSIEQLCFFFVSITGPSMHASVSSIRLVVCSDLEDGQSMNDILRCSTNV